MLLTMIFTHWELGGRCLKKYIIISDSLNYKEEGTQHITPDFRFTGHGQDGSPRVRVWKDSVWRFLLASLHEKASPCHWFHIWYGTSPRKEWKAAFLKWPKMIWIMSVILLRFKETPLQCVDCFLGCFPHDREADHRRHCMWTCLVCHAHIEQPVGSISSAHVSQIWPWPHGHWLNHAQHPKQNVTSLTHK